MRARLDLTAGQVWTLSLGLVLGVLLLATSVPPVWERRGLVAPTAAAPPSAVAPPVGGLITGLVPPAPPAVPAVEPAPAPLPDPVDAPVALAPAPVEEAPVPQPAPSPAAPPPPVIGLAEPLRIVEAGYTSSGPEPGLPPDGLPISARLGERTSTVHVRLTGQASRLTISLSTASGANVRSEDAVVRACRITTTDWEPERPGPGVPFDTDDCVDGVLSATDVVFDLGVFTERDGRAGFALVADVRTGTATGPRTFRLTLDPKDAR